MISYGNELKRRSIIVRPSSIHGYGVFAAEEIVANEVVEECMVLMSDSSHPSLGNYYFLVDKKRGLALGYGSIYNHAEEPNTGYIFDKERSILTFFAMRNIAPGEEILVFYGPRWFKERSVPVKKPSWRYRLTHSKPLASICRFLLVSSVLVLLQYLNLFIKHHHLFVTFTPQ